MLLPTSRPAQALLASALLFLPTAAAVGQSYTVTNIADTSGPFGDFLNGRPAINASGTVAFTALLDSGVRGIYTGNGGAVTTVVDTNTTLPTPVSPASPFYGFDISPAINDNGTVAFVGIAQGSAQGAVYTASGGSITTVATTTLSSGPYFFNRFGTPSINTGGTVSFFASQLNSPTGSADTIYAANGTTLTPLVTANDFTPAPSFVTLPERSALSDDGRAVFVASTLGGPIGLYRASNRVATPLVLNTGPFANFNENVAVNASNTVVFQAALATPGRDGIFSVPLDGGAVTPLVDDLGLFNNFGAPAINAAGRIAFVASLDDGTVALFNGPDAVANRVLAVGDPLFGSTVTQLFVSDESLSDAGSIAFRYTLASGVTGVAVTSPVPEPAGLTLLGIGAMALLKRKRPAW